MDSKTTWNEMNHRWIAQANYKRKNLVIYHLRKALKNLLKETNRGQQPCAIQFVEAADKAIEKANTELSRKNIGDPSPSPGEPNAGIPPAETTLPKA